MISLYCGYCNPRRQPIHQQTRSPEEQGETEKVLVEEFDASPATYNDDDSGVRLHVGPGCLRPGQVAGPISVIPNKRYIVESGGSSFLVSTVVDCKPSGAFFLKPLDLEFCIGEGDGDEELDESDGEDGKHGEDSDESDGEDGKHGEDSDESAPDEEGLQEYLARLRTTYKVALSLAMVAPAFVPSATLGVEPERNAIRYLSLFECTYHMLI